MRRSTESLSGTALPSSHPSAGPGGAASTMPAEQRHGNQGGMGLRPHLFQLVQKEVNVKCHLLQRFVWSYL